jgi:hypothetical protein
MGVVEAKIQTAEEIYRLLWAAVAKRRPIAARLSRTPAAVLPAQAGRNKEGEVRVLCYRYGGESERGLKPAGSPANWRCGVLEKLGRVKLQDDGWHTAPNHSRPASCIIKPDIDAEDYPERDPQKGH